jgi:hypothetical protein
VPSSSVSSSICSSSSISSSISSSSSSSSSISISISISSCCCAHPTLDSPTRTSPPRHEEMVPGRGLKAGSACAKVSLAPDQAARASLYPGRHSLCNGLRSSFLWHGCAADTVALSDQQTCRPWQRYSPACVIKVCAARARRLRPSLGASAGSVGPRLQQQHHGQWQRLGVPCPCITWPRGDGSPCGSCHRGSPRACRPT